jgi:hypothetical protein
MISTVTSAEPTAPERARRVAEFRGDGGSKAGSRERLRTASEIAIVLVT